jgi:hypothetical protein
MTSGHSLPNQGGTTKRTKPSSLTVRRGRRLFLFEAAEKASLQHSRSSGPFDVLWTYASGVVLPAALPVERRVSARRGWVGESGGLFEHPDGSVKEEKPWNG